MHAIVYDVHPVHLVLSIKIGIKSLFDVLNDWPPRIVVVDEVPETRGINYRKAETNAILFNVGAYRLNRYGLGNDVEAWSFSLLGRVQRGIEEGIDKSRLPKPGFT